MLEVVVTVMAVAAVVQARFKEQERVLQTVSFNALTTGE